RSCAETTRTHRWASSSEITCRLTLRPLPSACLISSQSSLASSGLASLLLLSLGAVLTSTALGRLLLLPLTMPNLIATTRSTTWAATAT
ncbi:hypothetical protein GGI16_006762, partial [Coemansia sp. S142-1]